MKQRRERLLEFADQINCDTLVAFEPENLFYMTGFWGEAVGMLEKNGRTTIIAPQLEAARAQDESHDCDVIVADRGSLLTPLATQLQSSRACTDCKDYSAATLLKKSTPSVKLVSEPFHRARIVKDAAEINILKRASRIIDEMFELCAKKMRAGQKESELQAVLVSYAAGREMFDTGYKSTLNPLIVAGGANGALPHAQVTNRKFKRRDLVVVDLTLRYKGYVSDATRTFAIGNVPPRAKEAYEVVKESQRIGLCSAKPNVKCKDVDLACRNFIEQKDFGKYFIHSTGHGIGLEVHEPPSISCQAEALLEKNMAITIEPGIYIPGKFGVRIEDSMIVSGRPSPLHKFTKDLVTV